MSFSKPKEAPPRKSKSQIRWELSKEQGTMLRQIEDQAARLSETLNVSKRRDFTKNFLEF